MGVVEMGLESGGQGRRGSGRLDWADCLKEL